MQDQGIAIDNIFVDMESGATPPLHRPSFKRMMDRLEEGNVDELVFSEYSRIGRDVVDSLGVVLDIMRINRETKLRSLAANERDINQYPVDMQFVIIMFSMGAAQREREHIKERTRWGMDNAKQKGTKSGKPIGRPKAEIDFAAVNKLMAEKNLLEAQAMRVLGYKPRTFYAAKKKRGMGEQHD